MTFVSRVTYPVVEGFLYPLVPVRSFRPEHLPKPGGVDERDEEGGSPERLSRRTGLSHFPPYPSPVVSKEHRLHLLTLYSRPSERSSTLNFLRVDGDVRSVSTSLTVRVEINFESQRDPRVLRTR